MRYYREFVHRVQPTINNSRSPYIAAAICLAYFCAGQFFIPLLGIQNDEALFASPLLQPKSWEYAVHVGKSQWALMLMTYLGTLKTLLFKPLLRWFGTGVFSIREPMLLAGAASVWLFYCLLRRIAGERAAVVGCCLLGSDTLYLLTSVFDWGPVALQHLLLVSGMLLMVCFYQQTSQRALAGGCFLFGLAMWDKALAWWVLSGVAVATAVVFWREIRKVASRRNSAIAVLAFLLGASPLLVYNRHSHWSTFRSNAAMDASDLAQKADALLETARGPGMLGLFTEEAHRPPMPHAPSGWIQNASAAIGDLTGHPENNLIVFGLVLALMLTPATRGIDLRACLFAWIAMAVAWTQMALTAHAGGSVHHAILMWPLPYIAMAVPMAAASRQLGRAGLQVLAVFVALLGISNALVTNEYYYRMVRQGGATAWSDAIWPLADYLKGSTAPYIFCVDWGMLDNLRLIGRGKLILRDGTEHTSRVDPTAEDREILRGTLAIPGALFVGHTKEAEIFPGDTERLLKAANEAGLRPDLLVTIKDSFGRPTFEVYRFVP